ncbi:hypothetical protein Tco_0763677, partial [Tanacetum coccineum]
ASKKKKAPSASEPTKSGGGKQKRSLGNEVIRMTWVPQLRVPDDQLSVQNKQHVTEPGPIQASNEKQQQQKNVSYESCQHINRASGDHMITETSKRKWDTGFGNCLVLFGAILS